jgi:hypothetical protein
VNCQPKPRVRALGSEALAVAHTEASRRHPRGAAGSTWAAGDDGGVAADVALRRQVGARAVPSEGGEPSGAAGGLAKALTPNGVLAIALMALAVAKRWPPVVNTLLGAQINSEGFGASSGRLQPLTNPALCCWCRC